MPAGNGEPRRSGIRRRKSKIVDASVRGYDHVEFTRHAVDRMKQRGVTEQQAINAIRSPTRKGLRTQPGRKRFRKIRPGGTTAVDVVFKELADRILVVTVIVVSLRRKRRRK
jgi:hypothetical protein